MGEQVNKEVYCYEWLRKINKEKAHIFTLQRYAQHLQDVVEFLSKKIEKERHKSVRAKLSRFVKMIEADIASALLAAKKRLEELEIQDAAWEEECAAIVAYTLVKLRGNEGVM